MEYSFDKTKSEMEEIFIKESNNYCSPSSLTHYKGQFNQEKDNVKKFSIITSKTTFKYKLLNYSFTSLQQAKILLNIDQLLENHKNIQENSIKIIIQKAHDTQFDVIFRNSKDENIESFLFTYENYRRFYIDSCELTSVHLGLAGILNITNFIRFLNSNFIREEEKEENQDDLDDFDFVDK